MDSRVPKLYCAFILNTTLQLATLKDMFVACCETLEDDFRMHITARDSLFPPVMQGHPRFPRQHVNGVVAVTFVSAKVL